jgi:hypothetical protein
VSPGRCAQCRSCAAGCGGAFAGFCPGDLTLASGSGGFGMMLGSSGSESYTEYLGYVLILPIIAVAGYRMFRVWRSQQAANRDIREVKLLEHRLARVHLENSTGVPVQVRTPAR